MTGQELLNLLNTYTEDELQREVCIQDPDSGWIYETYDIETANVSEGSPVETISESMVENVDYFKTLLIRGSW